MRVMYCRKSTEPRMEPLGIPAITEYSCNNLISRANLLLLRSVKIQPKGQPEIL